MSVTLRPIPHRAPPWPLPAYVPGHPFQELLDLPFAEACAHLQQTIGTTLLPPAVHFRELFLAGAISRKELDRVANAAWTTPGLLQAVGLAPDTGAPEEIEEPRSVLGIDCSNPVPPPYLPVATALEPLFLWQLAYELGYLHSLAQSLATAPAHTPRERPDFQAVFCMDVRAEVLRRHLESAAPGCETLSCSGHFGFPLAPHHFTALPIPDVAFPPLDASDFSPDPDLLAAQAEDALRKMNLVRDFSRLILLCGHGSKPTSTSHTSAFDCAACGGRPGDRSARLAAYTLNRPEVRERLAHRGIVLPADTWFIAGLHNTATNDITLFALNAVPATHQAELSELQCALVSASIATRRERAASLGLEGLQDESITVVLRSWANPASGQRPEWGSANNAAILIGPRAQTRNLSLSGRVFLHEYAAENDPEGSLLEALLTGPVPIACGISLQYFASRVAPEYFAADDSTREHDDGHTSQTGVVTATAKTPVMGMPLHALHDGIAFRHEPRRLSVIIHASRERIDTVLARQPKIRRLFENGWFHLLAWGHSEPYYYVHTDNWAEV